MSVVKHDPWALLAETRDAVGYCPMTQDGMDAIADLRNRIDAALAEREAEEKVEVRWRPIGCFGDVDEHVATIGKIEMTVHMKPVSYTGDLLWEVRHTYAASGTAPTLDDAKAAAIRAARGMR